MMSKTKIKDILDYEFPSGLIISEDKSKIAYKNTKANYEENKYNHDLWFYDIKSDKNYQVTDIGDASIYTFNKDSDLIFKSKSKDKKDIFKKVSENGVGKKIFEIKKDVDSIKWLDDNLYLIKAKDKKSKEDKESEKYDDYFKELNKLPFWFNGEGYLKDNDAAYYFYDSSKDELTKIIKTDINNQIHGFDVNKDRTKAVYVRGRYTDNKVMELYDDLILLDIETGEEKVLIENEFSYYTANFLEDKIIFVGTDMKKGGVNEDAFVYACDFDGTYRKITDDSFDMAFGNSIGTDARFGAQRSFAVENDSLYFVVTEKENSKLYSIDLEGNIKTEIAGSVEDFAIKDDEIYYLSMSEDSLAELRYAGSNEILVKNKIKSKIGKIETFTFKSNGDDIKGFVLLPTNFDENKKYPTLLSVHGGPKTEFSDIFHHEHQVFANDGYIVIYTNPHGSSGNGVAYSDIRGLYGQKDYEDLMNFLDIAIDKYPQIDTNNMGIYGGSYGGFMTNWTIGHTNRFKAACAQRSISNWTSFYGVSDIGYYFGSDQTNSNPWDSLEKMWDQSPIKYANKATTPTLFIHADEDYRCPLEQGLQMYTKLKLNGVETKMFVFHGENHELSRSGKPKPRIKRLKEIKKWFDGYLK